MDRDTTQKKNSHEKMFKQFRAHKADVLIGTQMIAKGFHFPSATLVGILNADSALQIPDFRSSESVFQLIAQASGRSGRSDLKGEVILQTFLPQHPLLHLAAEQNYAAFYEREIEERRQFSFPPFCRLAKVLFSGLDENETLEAITHFRKALVSAALPDTEILPALPAGHPKIKDRYRFQFLIKTRSIPPLSDCLATLRLGALTNRKIYILIDIDPTSTFF
jgi:primosomal protein N' (replication factor Y)